MRRQYDRNILVTLAMNGKPITESKIGRNMIINCVVLIEPRQWYNVQGVNRSGVVTGHIESTESKIKRDVRSWSKRMRIIGGTAVTYSKCK